MKDISIRMTKIKLKSIQKIHNSIFKKKDGYVVSGYAFDLITVFVRYFRRIE